MLAGLPWFAPLGKPACVMVVCAYVHPTKRSDMPFPKSERTGAADAQLAPEKPAKPEKDRAPVTIKGFRTETRELMNRCARRQGATLAEWLDRAIHMLARHEGVLDPVQAPPTGGWASLAARNQPNRFMLAPDQPSERQTAIRALLDVSAFEVETSREWLEMAAQLASTLASFTVAAHHASQASGKPMSKAAAGRVFSAVDSFAKLAKGEVPRSITPRKPAVAPTADPPVLPGQSEPVEGQTFEVVKVRTRGLKNGNHQRGRLPAHA